MYAVIKTPRATLISPAEVIKVIQKSSGTLPYEQVQSAIIVAEERFLRPALTYDFYDELVAAKNLTVTDGNKDALQDLIDAALQGTQGYALQVGDIVNASELLSADQLDLWNKALLVYTAECVRIVCLPENFLQLTASGLTKNNPVGSVMPDSHSDSVGASKGDVQFLMDKVMDGRVTVLEKALGEYLCRNKSKFPSYDKVCQGDDENAPLNMQGGWVFPSAYKDEEDERCW